MDREGTHSFASGDRECMYGWRYPLKLLGRKRATGEDSCPLFSCKSPAVSCSSPKQDPRPPFKLFLSPSSLPRCQPRHASSKFPPSPVPPHFLTTSPTSCFSQLWPPAAPRLRPQHRHSQSPCPPAIYHCCPPRKGSQPHCCTPPVLCSLPPLQTFILLLLFPQLIIHSHPVPGQKPTPHQ